MDLATRIGINSGGVMVGRIGDDLRMGYAAYGHTVSLAQRMESMAEPNTCFVSAPTAAQTLSCQPECNFRSGVGIGVGTTEQGDISVWERIADGFAEQRAPQKTIVNMQ